MNPINDTQHGVVKRMRELRDELGEKLSKMTWEEEKEYIRQGTLSVDPTFYERLEKKKELIQNVNKS